MKYFAKITTLDGLKKEYRRLAMIHHPDVGGTVEAMQAINAEFEARFPLLRMEANRTAATPTEETAAGFRSEFYTANGWKGRNYTPGLTLKEIAVLVRKYIKENFPTYKFSVRTKYASMCQELLVDMREAPCPVYKSLDDLTPDDVETIIRRASHDYVWTLCSWSDAEARAEIQRLWETKGNWYKVPADQIAATAEAVDSFVKSYNYSDCDGMIDYFDVNFYYFGCLEDNARRVQYVPKTPRVTAKRTASKAPTKPQETALRVEINPEHDGIEVYFPGKPSDAVRAGLKADGWRWHRQKGCWYNRNTEAHLQQLRALTEPTLA